MGEDADFDAGAVPGVDAAGVVRVAAADGSGPPAGARDVTFGMGGASGEVGRLAVQLAVRAGAHVVAAVGSTARGAGLVELERRRGGARRLEVFVVGGAMADDLAVLLGLVEIGPWTRRSGGGRAGAAAPTPRRP